MEETSATAPIVASEPVSETATSLEVPNESSPPKESPKESKDSIIPSMKHGRRSAAPATLLDFEPPVACIRRILKQALPASTAVNKDASAALVRACGVFVLYATSAANDVAREHRRQTITAQDVIVAMKELDLEDFVPDMQAYLETYRAQEKGKREAKAAARKEKEGKGKEKEEKDESQEEKGEEKEDAEDDDKMEEDKEESNVVDGTKEETDKTSGEEQPAEDVKAVEAAATAEDEPPAKRVKVDEETEA